MLSKVVAIIPFWQTISWYSSEARRKALPKFLLLWAMSLSPLALAALLQEVPQDSSMLGAFFGKFARSFFARHQFIYAVSFITPILYLGWERHRDLLAYFVSRKRAMAGVKLTPPGFGCILLWSLVFFLLTTVAYANTEAHAATPNSRTILGTASDYITVVVYVFGLACWYFMMLDGYAGPVGEYHRAVVQEEEEATEQAEEFSKRVSGGGEVEA